MAELRFYAELNRFLAPQRRGRAFAHAAAPHESVKHVVESLGVPHTEVALVLLGGEPVGLEHRPLRDGDRVAVFPAFRTLAPLQEAREPVPAPPRFAADAHLGRLARYLRFAGYDTLFRNDWPDAELVATAAAEDRMLLTRDRDLLMRREVRQGCYLHETEALAQFRELARRVGLAPEGGGAGRCMLCNAVLEPVPKAEVAAQLPPRTREHFDAFWRCPECARVYWRGSHWERMRRELGAREGGPAEKPVAECGNFAHLRSLEKE
ncbi:Mut7-C RNAse domain-containing protein [Caldimonas tepidiphila]|uniref:Mut7-C RNAse domain-containing protein n=1 Tax=Caldimonas tepidiphila TaxID=2315841 RepID=UPI000E5A5F2C|nr:Mut7-C RNAse domain-containing protein [Caldimonas tepidiphila]